MRSTKKGSGNYNHPYFPSLFPKTGSNRTGTGTYLADRQLGGDWYCGFCATTETSKSDPHWLQRAAELADLILIEADGSKRLPCKVPDSHEPVILPQTDVVVAVLGLSALNLPLKDCCFRLDKATKLLSAKESHPLTCQHMATIFASSQGLRKATNNSEYVVVLNQCDNEDRKNAGEQISDILCGLDPTINHIILTKLHP